MASNRHTRRKDKAVNKSQNKRPKTSPAKKQMINRDDPIENFKFLDRVQAGAPINFHLETMFSNIKIGDIDFLSLYNQCMSSTSTSAPSWKIFRRAQRALTLGQYFDYTLSIPGSKAECGVFRGFSALLTNRIAQMRDKSWTGDNYHLIDSFEGLSEPELNDAINFTSDVSGNQTPLISHKAGAFATPLIEVQNNLTSFQNLNFHKGWIPEIFLSLPEDEWSYVHIDVDLYRPTLKCLEYFFPRMATGGVIINDDYSSPLFPGGGSGWVEFFDKVKKPFTVLDTGQAIFVNT